MLLRRKYCLWLFSACLLSASVGMSEELQPRHSAAAQSEPSLLGFQPTDPDELLSRLERAEARIVELEAHRQAELDQPANPIQQIGFSPAHMAPLMFAHDPEIGIIHEQTSSSSLLNLQKDPSKPEVAKPKKWYDKLSIRGYAQFRMNDETRTEAGSTRPHYVGDRSLADDQGFLIRRARVILSGDVHEHVYVYLQTDFASSTSGQNPSNQFAQIRDWYADYYIDEQKEYRFRVGQSKVPYGWENMQSSSNRIPFDRADALNSAVRNERDLGVYFFYTPVWAQDFFRDVLDQGLKGSGNYGLFSFGTYNGQGGSFNEVNDNLHVFARLTVPVVFENRQRMEIGIQGYTGKYSVVGASIDPNGTAAPAAGQPDGTVNNNGLGLGATAAERAADKRGWNDERLAASFIWYPQPLGFQTEWTVGRGPALNAAQTAIEEKPLYGGYAMLLYKIDEHGTWFPYVRYSYYKGGYKSEQNAPFAEINEWEFGTEWQINSAAELTLGYLITDRTNTAAQPTGNVSYNQFDGQAIRLQFQINY